MTDHDPGAVAWLARQTVYELDQHSRPFLDNPADPDRVPFRVTEERREGLRRLARERLEPTGWSPDDIDRLCDAVFAKLAAGHPFTTAAGAA